MSRLKLLLIVLSFFITLVGFAIYNGSADQLVACYEYLDEHNLKFLPFGIGGAIATAIVGLLGGIPSN